MNNLSSPDLETRLAASNRLLDARAVDPLIALASDTSAPIEARWRAIVLLGWLADACAVDPLVALIADPSWDIRNDVVWSLGMIGAAEAIAPLYTVVTTSKDEQVPYIAALMLIRIDQTRARDLLTAALDHPEEAVQRIAHAALATL